MSAHWPDTTVQPGYWLGPAGGLLPLPDLKGELSMQGHPRDWSVSIPQAWPTEVAALYAMAAHDVSFSVNLAGARRASVSPSSPAASLGGLHWVTPYSRVANLLPMRSVDGPQGWAGASRFQGGPVALEDGMAASSIQLTGTGTSYSPLLPVVPGKRVTASVYARKAPDVAGTFRLDWMALGASQGDTPQSTAGSATVLTTAAPLARLVVSATVPANVHLARLTLVGVPQYAAPAFTWTRSVQPRSAGQGCPSAVVHDLSSTPLIAREGMVREEVSFTVSEVG